MKVGVSAMQCWLFVHGNQIILGDSVYFFREVKAK